MIYNYLFRSLYVHIYKKKHIFISITRLVRIQLALLSLGLGVLCVRCPKYYFIFKDNACPLIYNSIPPFTETNKYKVLQEYVKENLSTKKIPKDSCVTYILWLYYLGWLLYRQINRYLTISPIPSRIDKLCKILDTRSFFTFTEFTFSCLIIKVQPLNFVHFVKN